LQTAIAFADRVFDPGHLAARSAVAIAGPRITGEAAKACASVTGFSGA